MAACLVCSGCSGAESSVGSELDEEAAPLRRAPTFIDARDYFHEPEAVDAWYALTTTLRQNFDDVCGDTFCEGDYSNYERPRERFTNAGQTPPFVSLPRTTSSLYDGLVECL